jgi:hypothetical protein
MSGRKKAQPSDAANHRRRHARFWHKAEIRADALNVSFWLKADDAWLAICLWTLTLLNWDFRAHDGRDHAVHMIFVAQKAVLARRAFIVTSLAEILFHLTEIGHEVFRIPLLVALEIRAALFEVMAGQTTAVLQHAEMRLMDEIRESSLLALDRRRGKINEPPFAPDIVDAVAFRT